MKDRRRRYSLLARTAARKSPGQLLGILSRKARNRVVPRLPLDVDKRYQRRIPDDLTTNFEPHSVDTHRLRSALSEAEKQQYQSLATEFNNGSITFLNRTREISDPAEVGPEDNRLSGLPRLWFIKLAAFEPFRWGILGYETPNEIEEFATRASVWLRTCVSTEQIGSRREYLRGFWAPYSVSLRVIALSRFGAWKNGLTDTEERFLYKNLLFLENNVEHDVGGNHLIENGAALVIGGSVFPGVGDRFVDEGLDILQSTAETQFLDDGYHFERSPMYHLEVTERMLSVLSILTVGASDPPKWLTDVVTDACSFAEYLRPPDGRIPLLNDAVFEQAHYLETVLSYASSIGVDVRYIEHPGDSQLEWFETEGITLLFDAGDSGPGHQMAHTHNDPCTLLVWNDDHRMITDTGVFDYQPGEKRRISRSIEAHNTVQINEQEPVSYGGRFRMSEPVTTTTTVATNDGVVARTAECETGEKELYCHRRTVYSGDRWLLVWDQVEAELSSYISRLHAHPDVAVRHESEVTFTHKNGPELCIKPVAVEEVKNTTGPYFPKFGVQQNRAVVELYASNCEFGYFIIDGDTEIQLDQTDTGPRAVYVNGSTNLLPEVRK